MQFFKASVLSALVASVAALQVTSPAQGSSLDLTKTNTITWTSVSSDPTSFAIYLVNQAVNPSVSIEIASDVQTSADSYTLKALSGVTAGADYQINLVSTTANNQGILAQSAQFTVVTSGSSTTSASFSSSTPSTSGTSTSSGSTTTSTASTLTTTTSGSSTSSSASAAGSSSTASSTSASSKSSSGTSTATSSASTSSSSSSTNAAAGLHLASGAAGLSFVGVLVALFA